MSFHSIERRKNPRAYIRLRALITASSDKSSKISGWIHNVSLEGVGVEAKSRSSFGGVFQEGDEIEVRSSEDYFEFYGRGRIAWISPLKDMMGIKFIRLYQKSKEALEELLRLFPAFSVSIDDTLYL